VPPNLSAGSLRGVDAAASLARPATVLHVLKATIAVAVVLTVARLEPATLAWVVADLARRHGRETGNGHRRAGHDGGGESGDEDGDDGGLHFCFSEGLLIDEKGD